MTQATDSVRSVETSTDLSTVVRGGTFHPGLSSATVAVAALMIESPASPLRVLETQPFV